MALSVLNKRWQTLYNNNLLFHVENFCERFNDKFNKNISEEIINSYFLTIKYI